MFIKLKINQKVNNKCRYILPALLFYFLPGLVFAQVKDSSAVILKKVVVSKPIVPNTFKNIIPAQSLNVQTLQQINAQSVGDAARYFSGVLIKDYGGVGGLKTISVRSLGGTNTGITYDGIPVSDVQSGQIDLSRFSSTFVQSLNLYQANPSNLLSPARAYASSSVLSITTNTFNELNFSKSKWQAGLKAGSFGLWQPFAGIYLPTGKASAISANAEMVSSKGDYPFYINNGNLSEKAKRENSKIKSFQGEINFIKQFKDSSTWQTKASGYTSKRGLPGAVIFYNNRSVQKLWNEDIFLQSRYNKKFNEGTSLLVLAKYSHNYTRYIDPDFLNNSGGRDDRYKQNEFYASVSVSQKIIKNVSIAFASDASTAKLLANKSNFAFPSRLSLWNNVSARYSNSFFQLNVSLLDTYIQDKVKTGASASDKNKLTPTFAASFKPAPSSPFMFRFFYKDVFRMPTFNDLYYNFIGNSNLRPEYAEQYNLGVSFSKIFSGKINEFNFSADGYFNKIKDKIIAVPSQNLFTWTMLNLGKVQIKGVDITTEASGKFSADWSWFTRIAYTYQQAVDVTNPASSSYKERIPYTPDNSGSALVTINYKKWSAGYSLLFSGTRYALGGNNYANELNGWSTHDISISRSLPSKYFKVNVKAEADNITNQYYDVVRNFPMPGRSFKISITFNNI